MSVQAIIQMGFSQCYYTVITEMRKYSKSNGFFQYENILKYPRLEEKVTVNTDFQIPVQRGQRPSHEY